MSASPLLVALSIFMLTGLWGAIAWQIHRDREDAIRTAEIELRNLVRAFAEHTAKSLEGADQAIRFTRNEYLERGRDLDIASYLSQKKIIGSAYHLLSVIGPDGFVTHSSQPFQRVDLRDREHFRVHATDTVDKLFISKPVLGRVSKKWSIQLTRRIDMPDGSFGGVVVLSLSPDYLTRFYSEVDLGRDGAITLVGDDGFVRARASQDDAIGSLDVTAGPLFREAVKRRVGTLQSASRIDHIERITAFHALDDYKLLVFAGKSVETIMVEPRQRSRVYLLVGMVVSVALIAFVAQLARRAQQQTRLVKELKDSNERSDAANRMKTRFLASVSHELRTPLNGILGYAELIRDGCSEDESREFGAVIRQSAEHLHGLVNTILDLAKIESGRMELRVSRIAVAEVLSEAIRLSAVHAQSRGLSLRLQLGTSAPADIDTDRAKLVQILNNLLNNAIKFTERGEIVVSASGDSQWLVIHVADPGIGIPPSRIAGLFTRFQGRTTEVAHPGEGAGLGLSLSKELAELLGGSIAVESEVGRGTTMTLRLPAIATNPGAST